MRDRLRSELGTVRYPKFLVYLMGPYTSLDVESCTLESRDIDESDDTAASRDDGIDETVALLRRVQGSLRTQPGVNAFLAVDAGIPLDVADAATQSIRFAAASNAVAFVVPRFGDNLGVGIEVGCVLQHGGVDCDRLLVVHEDAVTSAMLDAVTNRWEARITTYADEGELVDELRQFAAEIMLREATGTLPRKDG